MKDLNTLYIQLGFSCNMSCRHCSQNSVKSCFSNIKDVDSSIYKFIEKWSKYGRKNIIFWGGEPLLYWLTIQEIISRLEELGIYNINYSIYSNGLLLTQEMVYYINSHNITFVMSYDAPNPTVLRNKVPTDYICSLFMKINNRGLNTVYSALNDDIKETVEYLEDKFPDTKMNIGIVVTHVGTPEDAYDFKEDSIEKSIKYATEKAYVDSNYANFLRKFYKNIKDYVSPCKQGIYSLTVNLNGEISFCHNAQIYMGKITDDLSVIRKKHEEYFKSLIPPNCYTCEYYQSCGTFCSISEKTVDGKELKHCKYMRKIFKAIKNGKQLWT